MLYWRYIMLHNVSLRKASVFPEEGQCFPWGRPVFSLRKASVAITTGVIVVFTTTRCEGVITYWRDCCFFETLTLSTRCHQVSELQSIWLSNLEAEVISPEKHLRTLLSCWRYSYLHSIGSIMNYGQRYIKILNFSKGKLKF